jgi:hypothetical protein
MHTAGHSGPFTGKTWVPFMSLRGRERRMSIKVLDSWKKKENRGSIRGVHDPVATRFFSLPSLLGENSKWHLLERIFVSMTREGRQKC